MLTYQNTVYTHRLLTSVIWQKPVLSSWLNCRCKFYILLHNFFLFVLFFSVFVTFSIILFILSLFYLSLFHHSVFFFRLLFLFQSSSFFLSLFIYLFTYLFIYFCLSVLYILYVSPEPFLLILFTTVKYDGSLCKSFNHVITRSSTRCLTRFSTQSWMQIYEWFSCLKTKISASNYLLDSKKKKKKKKKKNCT